MKDDCNIGVSPIVNYKMPIVFYGKPGKMYKRMPLPKFLE